MWGFVRAGLEDLLAKYHDRWIPEDVYFEIRSGAAALFMIDVDEEQKGFTVLKNFNDVDGLALFIWTLWAEPNTMKEEGRYEQVLFEMEKIAKGMGAKRIRHYSPRGGWTVKGLFELKMHIYEREI